MDHAQETLGVSQRRARRVLGQNRAVHRHTPITRDDEDALTKRIIELAAVYGRYGTPRITALLRREGWAVNHKRVERIWRREGLKVPRKQPKRGRLWLNDGSCVRLRPEHKDHVWAYDFVQTRTTDGRPLRMLVVVDEYTRECLSIDVARTLNSDDVLERIAWLMATRGVPEHIRSDNGPEFTATAVRNWLGKVGVKTLLIEPGSPWENGYVESLNGKAASRSAGPRSLRDAAGGTGTHRAMAGALQHGEATLVAGLPPPGTRNHRCWPTLRSAPGGPVAACNRRNTHIDSGLLTGERSNRMDEFDLPPEGMKFKSSCPDSHGGAKGQHRSAQCRGAMVELFDGVIDAALIRVWDTMPEIHEHLWAVLTTFELAEVDERFAQVAVSCRRLIEYAADCLYLPKATRDGERKLDQAAWKNRLLKYLEENQIAEADRGMITANIEHMAAYMDRLLKIINKGV